MVEIKSSKEAYFYERCKVNEYRFHTQKYGKPCQLKVAGFTFKDSGMQTTHKSITMKFSKRSLSYNIHDIPIPYDLEALTPINICWELTKLGWIEKGVNGIPHLYPNDQPINKWIWEPNALPNQYWDSKASDAEASSSAQGEPSQPPPYGDNMSQQINWMAQ